MNGIDLGAQEEHVVDTFAFAVHQVLQDNGRQMFDITN
jgi:hypothetical protein